MLDRPVAPLPDSRSFATPRALEKWLEVHHATKTELWVRIWKQGSGTPSVTWNDCVLEALCWGWIDGQKKSLDEASFLQRLTPRRKKSGWSKRNREHADRLIAEGRMQAPGLAQVEAARQDGRWERAYAGSADMVLPEEFLALLRENAAAKKFYATLDRKNLFAIYYRLHSAKRPETRQKRSLDIVLRLARGEAFH